MAQATLTSKGQITIPKAVRDRLDLRPGDRVDFIVNESGEAVIRRMSRTAVDVQGMLAHRSKKKLSVTQMDEAVRRRFREHEA